MSLKAQLKEKYGVDVKEAVERFEAKKDAFRKQKFDYDPSALADWTSNTLPNVITDLVGNSEFLSEFALETGVKGTREIALMNADITLSEKSGCTQSLDGSVVFTGVDLTTKLLEAGIEFCNETLNGKMTEILNVLGVKTQNGQLPAEIEDILMAYLMKRLDRKAQRLIVLGDTDSLDVELNILDGLVKLIEDSTTVTEYNSLETSITNVNAFNIAYGLATSIDAEIFDNGMAVRIYTGRAEALKIIKSYNDANPYTKVNPDMNGTSMVFALPETGVEIKTLPELNNLGKMFAIPMSLTFLGTDELSDMILEVKYDDYNDKLKAYCAFRLGTNIVWGKYFTKLVLTAS